MAFFIRKGERIAFNYLGHLVVGAIIGMYMAKTPAEMAIIMLASLLPDIDTPTSTFGRFNPFARWGWMTHRGFTHTLTGGVVLALPWYFLFGGRVFLLVLVACYGHIVADWAIGLLPKKQRLEIRFW